MYQQALEVIKQWELENSVPMKMEHKITECKIPVRLKTILLNNGITYLEELKQYDSEDMFRLRGFGHHCYWELTHAMEKYKISHSLY
jgi:DNA-directed RNA polymerase alpha subunit